MRPHVSEIAPAIGRCRGSLELQPRVVGEFYGMRFRQSTDCCDWYRKLHFSWFRTKTYQHRTLNNNRLQLEPVVGIEPEVPM